METEVNEAIKALVQKAKNAAPHEAMHLSQAALNLTHALLVKKQADLLK